MKFILLVEMPASVVGNKRIRMNKELQKISYFSPKRNVFLLEGDEKKVKKIKEWIINNSDPASKVHYYEIIDNSKIIKK